MHDIRCRCGKIVCQVENIPEVTQVDEKPGSFNSPTAIILCRHCKRYVVLKFPAMTGVNAAPVTEERPAVFFSGIM